MVQRAAWISVVQMSHLSQDSCTSKGREGCRAVLRDSIPLALGFFHDFWKNGGPGADSDLTAVDHDEKICQTLNNDS